MNAKKRKKSKPSVMKQKNKTKKTMERSAALDAQQSEAYLDIVWRQFKKNRFALWSLWLLLPIVLIAIFAPAIASNQPFVFSQDGQTIYPWFRAIFSYRRGGRLRFQYGNARLCPDIGGRFDLELFMAIVRRPRGAAVWGRALVLYTAVTTLLCVGFSIDGLSPTNPYRARTFRRRRAK